MSVDAGAADAQDRVDSSKPFHGKAFPGADIDVLVDAEEDRRRIRTPGRSVQPQSCLSVCHAAVVPAGEIRRVRPTGLAELVDADDVETQGAQRIRILTADGLEIEVCAGPRLGDVDDRPRIAGRFDLIRRDEPLGEIDQPKAGC